MSTRFNCMPRLLACAMLCIPSWALAETPARDNLLTLSASASLEVTKDLLSITLQVVKEGSDAAQVQTQIKQVLDAALAEAKKSARADGMAVRTGSFSLNPRHGKDGRIGGWQGQAELVLEGKDGPLVAQTAGRLAAMNVTQVAYSISRELGEKHEAAVAAQAVQKFRAQAAELARQFGFGNYVLREVTVQGAEQGGPSPVMFRRGDASVASVTDGPVPAEAGKGVLSATVSGTVRLVK